MEMALVKYLPISRGRGHLAHRRGHYGEYTCISVETSRKGLRGSVKGSVARTHRRGCSNKDIVSRMQGHQQRHSGNNEGALAETQRQGHRRSGED